MARRTCAYCDHDLPPGTRECPRCGALQLAGGRRIVVQHRATGRTTGARIRRAILVVLALALLAWLLYLEWSDLPEPDAPHNTSPAASGEP